MKFTKNLENSDLSSLKIVFVNRSSFSTLFAPPTHNYIEGLLIKLLKVINLLIMK